MDLKGSIYYLLEGCSDLRISLYGVLEAILIRVGGWHILGESKVDQD